MGALDQCEAANRTFDRQATHAGLTPCARVNLPTRPAVASAQDQRALGSKFSAWESHHQQARVVLFLCASDGRSGGRKKELVEVLLMKGDVVVAVHAAVGSSAELGAYVHLGREPYYRHSDPVAD